MSGTPGSGKKVMALVTGEIGGKKVIAMRAAGASGENAVKKIIAAGKENSRSGLVLLSIVVPFILGTFNVYFGHFFISWDIYNYPTGMSHIDNILCDINYPFWITTIRRWLYKYSLVF